MNNPASMVDMLNAFDPAMPHSDLELSAALTADTVILCIEVDFANRLAKYRNAAQALRVVQEALTKAAAESKNL